jgi:hypothetical protein
VGVGVGVGVGVDVGVGVGAVECAFVYEETMGWIECTIQLYTVATLC